MAIRKGVIKLDKRKIKNHLAYYWWVYPMIAVAAVIISRFVFDVINKPDKDKVFSVAVFADCDENRLKETLELCFSESRIEQINTFVGNAAANNYDKSRLLWARSLDCDIVIVSESNMMNNIGSVYFADLDAADENLNYYRENNVIYGVKLDSSDPDLSNFLTDEQAYLFVTVSGASRTEEVNRVINLLCK